MSEQVLKYKPGWNMNGKMYYYTAEGRLSQFESDAFSLPSLEEAWLYLEEKGILTEKCCVKMPTGRYVFSGINDRIFNERRALYGDKVYFKRETKSYMLKPLTNR